jgi:hypothetical protein
VAEDVAASSLTTPSVVADNVVVVAVAVPERDVRFRETMGEVNASEVVDGGQSALSAGPDLPPNETARRTVRIVRWKKSVW